MDRAQVSFAEAEGKANYPSILKWGELDQRLRTALWTPFYFFLDNGIAFDRDSEDYDGSHYFKDPQKSVLIREFVNRRHKFVHEWKDYFVRENCIKQWAEIFKKQDYINLLDLITFVVRDRDCPPDLIERLSEAFDEPFSPYRLSVEAKTIFPAIGHEQTESLKRDLSVAFASPFQGSKSHLQNSLGALGDGDYRATVREAIHAVESAVRDFTDDPNAVLSKASKRLVKEFGVHKALADAFEKLYAYTSDENGIRHALVLEENEKVGLDEAAFFLSACAAFVGFLSRKKLR